MADLLPGAEPFSHAGGAVGVLLCHGFTGSPQSLRAWAEFLAGHGLAVSVPLLPGHGTSWQDMARSTAADWYATAERALAALRAECSEVFVMGLSLGGCLALRLAERRGPDVSGLVLVNPSLAPDTRLFLLAPVLKYVLPSLPGVGSDIKKPGTTVLSYDRVPVRRGIAAADLAADHPRSARRYPARAGVPEQRGPCGRAAQHARAGGRPGSRSADRPDLQRQLSRCDNGQ